MSDKDSNLAEELNLSNPWVAAITQSRIEKALLGFPLPLAEGWDYGLLTLEIQKIAKPPIEDTPQSNRDAIKELGGLAKKAKALRKAIEDLGDTAEMAAFFDLLRRLEEETGRNQIDYQDDYLRLMVEPLVLIEHVLNRSASQIGLAPAQKPRWKQSRLAEKRVWFAISLTPIFEQAFGAQALSNNWKTEYGEEHPWPEFFRRVHSELFPEVKQLNLAEVLQDAARWIPKTQTFLEYLDSEEATRDSKTSE